MHPLTGLFLASIPLLLGGCAVPLGVAIASYAADGVLMLTTDKTSTDHAISMSLGKDCSLWRVVKGRAICIEHKPGEENPYDVDYDAPHREVGEGGMVTVYTASRDGGRMLSEPEAKLALSRPPSPTPSASRPEPATATPSAPPRERRTIEIADTATAAKAPPRTGRTGRQPGVVVPVGTASRTISKPAAKPAREIASLGGRKAPARAQPQLAKAPASRPRPVPIPDPAPAASPPSAIALAATQPEM